MPGYVENRRVLYVDDEENLLSSFRSLMRGKNVDVFTLNNPVRINDVLETSGPFAVVLSDERMPDQDGVATLEAVKEKHPETLRVLVTGYSDLEVTQKAINTAGIVNYVSKPWDDGHLRNLMQDLITRYNTAMERQYLIGEIKLKNETLHLLLDETIAGVVKLLSDIVASIGEDIATQSVRIKNLGDAVVKIMPDLEKRETWEISRALELFNLGLALLPPFVQMRISREGLSAVSSIPVAANHHLLAAELLKEIPQFENVATIILLQRKNFDGSGIPVSDRTRGKNIPLGARILRILLDLQAQSTDHFGGREILEKMKKLDRLYDTDLIATLLGGQPSQSTKRRDAVVSVEELRAGMVLLEDLVTQSGQVLLRRNATLTETFCRLLSQWGSTDPMNSPVRVLLNPDNR